ncbi:hypothetical protein [Deinococcus multiflagellatus]|uniref:Uncharacterized protein n=1 Tax=Deinococcus multiflagellatus TaxID=1656887 RepID=A0ABW1ZE53_9DEIO|nr:hypothetical protein [Deinococcus multiflagellatus]MBZ9712826.1 hypothetical protein [Deinococcus multiflagellatus]
MKRMFVLAAIGLSGVAGAQTWDTELGKLQLTGCVGKQDGVYCDFNFTLTQKQTARMTWYVRDFKVFKPDGTAQIADKVAFVDGKFDNYMSSTQEIFAGVPVKVQAYFNIPSTTASFRAMEIDEKRFENIAIRAESGRPTTPATLPSAAGITGFSLSLSNCQLQGQNYVCTATLTPTK